MSHKSARGSSGISGISMPRHCMSVLIISLKGLQTLRHARGAIEGVMEVDSSSEIDGPGGGSSPILARIDGLEDEEGFEQNVSGTVASQLSAASPETKAGDRQYTLRSAIPVRGLDAADVKYLESDWVKAWRLAPWKKLGERHRNL